WVINFPPTFGMYPFSTAVCGGETVTVPRDAGYNVDAAAVRRAVDDRTKVIFIASPNNPTGNVTGQETLLELLDTGVVVVVDEAYYEFSGRTFVPLVRERPNLIVLRTFSKWAGLGGLRAGYGIFPAGIAELIRRIKLPYNVNVAAIIAMRESLADVEYLRGNIRAIVRERERLVSLLREQGVLDPLPSEANFVLCRVKTADALEIKQELDRQGIFIRHFCMPSTEDMLRISVGKPEHTDALLGALARWQGGKYGK
ncbi:MAG: aminotransferase class I/II-fold pyridoxal phosphate-dependent enzyme, partial [Dehalococcoidia bacterium]|nr:aminotransferase class I/II-fold pyridoxal phosphate-dependent enzyme [Dehalococcoidia bacterium]